jgi:WXG100 family type VII secretion target
MSEILLRAEDARAAANQMKTAREAAGQQVTSVRQRLTELQGSFKGKTATAFDVKFEEWRSNADGLLEALQGLSNFLDQAATLIEQTDTDIASRLG